MPHSKTIRPTNAMATMTMITFVDSRNCRIMAVPP